MSTRFSTFVRNREGGRELVRIRLATADGGGYTVKLIVDRDGPDDEPRLLAQEPLPADLDLGTAPASLQPGPLDDALIDFLGNNEESADYGPISDWLAGLLFRGSVGTAWDAQVAAGHTRNLLEIEPPTMRLLPWEMMRRNDICLFTDVDHPLARALQLQPDTTRELVPLRLLVVEGTHDSALGTDEEIGGIADAIPAFGGRIDVQFLSEPSQKDLWKVFHEMQPHILHFAGHGLVDPFSNQPALQVGGWNLTRGHILNVMPHVPRLVVLNACRTARAVEQVQSLTSAFLTRKAAAVIGMHGDIRGKSAASFGVEFYQALAAGKLIDDAAAIARRAVYAEIGVIGMNRDWCLPSLTLRVRPEQVLPVRCSGDLNDNDLAEIRSRLFEPTRLFVDRVDERSEVVAAVDPDVGQAQRLLLVTGAMEVGKSLLVRYLRTRSALRGRRVRYLDFGGLGNLGYLEVLDVIRSTPDDVPSMTQPPGAYDQYDLDLASLLKGQLPPEVQGTVTGQRTDLGQDGVPRIFESFRTALARDSVVKPLLLIFDHIHGVARAYFQQFIYPYLIKKIALDEVKNVRLLVVLSSEQRRYYWPSDEAKMWKEVPVDLIEASEFTRLARQFLHFAGTKVAAEHLELIDWTQRNCIKNERWDPRQLIELRKYIPES